LGREAGRLRLGRYRKEASGEGRGRPPERLKGVENKSSVSAAGDDALPGRVWNKCFVVQLKGESATFHTSP
jgi:hypothetical protein